MLSTVARLRMGLGAGPFPGAAPHATLTLNEVGGALTAVAPLALAHAWFPPGERIFALAISMVLSAGF